MVHTLQEILCIFFSKKQKQQTSAWIVTQKKHFCTTLLLLFYYNNPVFVFFTKVFKLTLMIYWSKIITSIVIMILKNMVCIVNM